MKHFTVSCEDGVHDWLHLHPEINKSGLFQKVAECMMKSGKTSPEPKDIGKATGGSLSSSLQTRRSGNMQHTTSGRQEYSWRSSGTSGKASHRFRVTGFLEDGHSAIWFHSQAERPTEVDAGPATGKLKCIQE